MQQRVTLIALGVADLPRARNFYEQGLGWRPAQAMDDIVFYQFNGMVLGLRLLKALEAETGLLEGEPGTGGVTLSHNLASRSAVDALLNQAQAAGGTVLKPAQPSEWDGYSGYFQDPDGHAWEVAYNPFWPLESDGSVQIPTS